MKDIQKFKKINLQRFSKGDQAFVAEDREYQERSAAEVQWAVNIFKRKMTNGEVFDEFKILGFAGACITFLSDVSYDFFEKLEDVVDENTSNELYKLYDHLPKNKKLCKEIFDIIVVPISPWYCISHNIDPKKYYSLILKETDPFDEKDNLMPRFQDTVDIITFKIDKDKVEYKDGYFEQLTREESLNNKMVYFKKLKEYYDFKTQGLASTALSASLGAMYMPFELLPKFVSESAIIGGCSLGLGMTHTLSNGFNYLCNKAFPSIASPASATLSFMGGLGIVTGLQSALGYNVSIGAAAVTSFIGTGSGMLSNKLLTDRQVVDQEKENLLADEESIAPNNDALTLLSEEENKIIVDLSGILEYCAGISSKSISKNYSFELGDLDVIVTDVTDCEEEEGVTKPDDIKIKIIKSARAAVAYAIEDEALDYRMKLLQEQTRESEGFYSRVHLLCLMRQMDKEMGLSI